MPQELHIIYGFHSTPFGECLIGVTERGICSLYFGERKVVLEVLKIDWPQAILQEDSRPIQSIIGKLFQPDPLKQLQLDLRGTDFQARVWQALLNIPFGERVSYESVACSIGMPKATRAVASAIARNRISYLVPCHRVVRKDGKIHNYRWGAECKQAMLDWEANQKLKIFSTFD